MNRSCGTVVPDGHGPDRQAMCRARADLPATAATGWPRPAVGGHPRRVEQQRSGRLDRLLQRLAEGLRDRGQIDLSEALIITTLEVRTGADHSIRLRSRRSCARCDALGLVTRSSEVSRELEN